MTTKKLVFLLAVVFSGLLCSCSNAQPNPASSMTGKKILIVYLSRTNNTKAVAELIQQQVGGKLGLPPRVA